MVPLHAGYFIPQRNTLRGPVVQHTLLGTAAGTDITRGLNFASQQLARSSSSQQLHLFLLSWQDTEKTKFIYSRSIHL